MGGTVDKSYAYRVKLLCASALFASTAVQADTYVNTKAVVGLTDIVCYGNQHANGKKCPSIFKVQVFMVNGVDSGITGCIAVLPYNSLTVVTKSKEPTDEVALTYQIDSSETSAQFVPKLGGIEFIIPSGGPRYPDPRKVFVAGSDSTNKKEAILLIKPKENPLGGWGWRWTGDHLPAVTVNGNKCTGVDPIIVNSAD